MKVTFTLLSLMIALVFAFALVNPVYAGEKEKEFKRFERFEDRRFVDEEKEVIFVDDDSIFLVGDDLFFPERRFLFGAPRFLGPRFLGPRFFDD